MGGRGRQLRVDTTPRRTSPDFRRLWVGQGLSFLGSMVTATALPWQVFRMTHSSLAVGLLGLAQLVPHLLLALVGGAFADGIDKRRLLLIVTTAQLACSAALG